jgi:hypothetical protein
MNERIKKLARKAGCRPRTFTTGAMMYPHVDRDLEQFAVLIIQECADEILKWKSEPFPFDPEFAAKLIKEHFGVE